MTLSHRDPSDDRPPAPPSMPAQDGDVVRDGDGLVVDEYSDASFVSDDDMDVLDRPAALDDQDVLAKVADDADRTSEINRSESSRNDDVDADMGLGAEPRSPEELEDAAIGHELKGVAGVTRDGEVHGMRMFDSPDGTGREIPEDERD